MNLSRKYVYVGSIAAVAIVIVAVSGPSTSHPNISATQASRVPVRDRTHAVATAARGGTIVHLESDSQPSIRKAGRNTMTTSTVTCRNSEDPRCGEFYWDPPLEANQPMTVSIASAEAEMSTGSEADFRVVLDDPDAKSAFVAYTDFGDRGQGGPTHADCFSPSRYGPWTPPPREHGHDEVTLRHTFVAPGIYHVTVYAQSGCGMPYGSWARARTTVRVNPNDGSKFDYSDNSAYFVYNPGSAPSAGSTIADDGTPDDLRFTLMCMPNQAGDADVQCRFDLTNNSEHVATFPSGFRVGVNLDRNGEDVGGYIFSQPDVTELAPGATAQVSGHFQVQQPGQYSYAGWTVMKWTD